LDYPDPVPAGTYYDDDHGHQGSHCASGADVTAASFESETGTCIMFGSGEQKEPPDQDHFCDTCLKFLKARNLADIRSAWRDRDPRDA
jgi:hypothetical protein